MFLLLEISSSISIGILVVSGLWEISLFSGGLEDICCNTDLTFERQLFRVWAKIKIVFYSSGTIGYGVSIAGAQLFLKDGLCPFIADPSVAANAQANMTLKITEQTAIVFTFPISVFLGVFIADSVFYAKFRFDPVSSGDILITIQLVKPYLAWFALIFLMLLTKKPAPVFLGGMTAATVSVAYKFYLA